MIRVCELFAGVGGFRLGLEKASDKFKFVWANQWEPGKKKQHAFDCYVSHFGRENHVNLDISEVNKEEIPNHDLLVGGFPCQDYSVARTGEKEIQGKKGVLWWEIRNILEAKQPRFVLLENVDRLLKSPTKQRGRDFGVVLACFNELGYSVEWRVINAAEYGFSQRRRRIFIFAFKNDTEYAKHLNKHNLKEWIHETGFFQEEFPICTAKADCDGKLISIFEEKTLDSKQVTMKLSDIEDVSDNFNMEFENAGIMTHGVIHTEKTIPKYDGEFILLKDILENDVDEKYYIDEEEKLTKWQYLKGAKKIERISKTGPRFIFTQELLAFPDSIDRPSRPILISESSINRSTHVVRDSQTNRLRLLTPVEVERLNGFKDNWTNTGMPEKFRYFSMGNALVVDLVEKMGKTINLIVKNESIDNPNPREAGENLVDENKVYKTQEEILIKARQLIGVPFECIDKSGLLKEKKGGVGKMIEQDWFGIKNNSETYPDFKEAGVELKVTPYYFNSKGLRAKERLVCNTINYETENLEDFYQSSYWKKNKITLLVSYHDQTKEIDARRRRNRQSKLTDDEKYELKKKFKVDEVAIFKIPDCDLPTVINDWNIIARKIKEGKADKLSESDTKILAAATKGTTAKKSMRRKSLNSKGKAKGRAYSLKPAYMTDILNTYIYGKKEDKNIIKHTSNKLK